MASNKLLILTGPGGSGKSTVAELLRNKYGFSLIDGDQLDTEFFPKGGQRLPENIENLKRAHLKILREAKKEFAKGKNVVVEYIIFGDYVNFFNIFKKEFGNNLVIKVLFPLEDENILRDQNRECWTTGPDKIIATREDLLGCQDIIGKENYIDTTGQTPEEAADKIRNGI